mmetsp:Transcript_69164/g.175795  ORF Transcript_69164/g.175795 Transcript_69164/m.175795 type:complete len:423 (+) Transcript_69164:94-1362(+)
MRNGSALLQAVRFPREPPPSHTGPQRPLPHCACTRRLAPRRRKARPGSARLRACSHGQGPSFRLDARVDVIHEQIRRVERHRSQHQGQAVSQEEGVEEEERTLKQAVHPGLHEEVDAVHVEKRRDGDASAEGPPPPPVVLGVQVEVGEEHGHRTGHQQKHGECKQKDAVERINAGTPNGIEDVVQLNVDGTEGQEAGRKHLRDRALVPAASRDFSGQLVRLAREGALALVLLHGAVPADDAAKDREREGHASPHGEHQQNGREGEGRRGAVEDGHGVQEGPDNEGGADEHQSGHEDVPRPLLAAKLLVEVRAAVTSNSGRDHVRHHAGGGHGAALVEDTDAADQHDHHDHAEELCTGAHCRAEEKPVLRGAEDISMEEFPTCLLLNGVQLLIRDLEVPRQVRADDTDDDQQEQRQDQQHEDK